MPVQPGLCFVPVVPAPNGKLHIFDTEVNWQVSPKWTLALEGGLRHQPHVGEQQRRTIVGTGSHLGGAGYAEYQLSAKSYLVARGEYLSDRGSFFTAACSATLPRH